MDSKGISIVWTFLSSTFIYAGSMQFVAVALLGTGFDPIYAILMTLMVNARHLFYGISMLGKLKGTGKLKPYLIFCLSDETFSILVSTEPPNGVDRKWFMFFVALLDHLYWIMGSVVGGLIGSVISFNTKGIDFVLTALFVVILVNQWKSTSNHLPAIIGIISAIACRLIFGATHFIIPSMLMILFFVSTLKMPIEMRKNS